MRLIDADALLENQPKGCYRTSDWINDAPTIGAIPVEWLETHKMDCIDDWGVVPVSIGRALIMWQKEQGAR